MDNYTILLIVIIHYWLVLFTQTAAVTVGFSPSTYTFPGGVGYVNLTLVVSGLVGTGMLECPIEVAIEYMDGPKASMYIHIFLSRSNSTAYS